MKNRLRSLSLFLLVITALTVLAVLPAYAEDADELPFEVISRENRGDYDVIEFRYPEGFTVRPPMRASGGEKNALGLTEAETDRMKYEMQTAIDNRKAYIIISKYGIPYDLELSRVFTTLIAENPDNVIVKKLAYAKAEADGKTIFYAVAFYYYTDAEVRAIKAAADRMLEGVAESGLSDAEKALAVHDRLAVRCEYDYTNLKLSGGDTSKMPEHDFQTYGALVDRICVCEGYAKAYMYLMRLLGIPAEYVTSTALVHAWNIVTVDGERYHVDVTHDDPLTNNRDVLGRVMHTNFLVSTTALKAAGSHTADDYDSTPDDTTYDNAFWSGYQTNFVPFGGKLYFITDDGKLDSLENGTVSQVLDLTSAFGDGALWRSEGGRVWDGFYGMLSGDSEALYFSLAKSIYRYVPGDASASLFYTPAETGPAVGHLIYGFRVLDGVFDYVTAASPSGRSSASVLHYVYVPGDVNGDGKVNIRDVTDLLRFAALPEQYPLSVSADYNGDGSVDILDASLLLQYSLFPDIYPLG